MTVTWLPTVSVIGGIFGGSGRACGLRQPVEGVDDHAVGGSDGGLVVAEIARELAGVANPGAVLVVEQVPVDGEPLRHQQRAVER
jgi:hypothetical protein